MSLTSAYKMLLNLPKNVYPSENEIASLELEHQIKIIDAVNAQQKLIKTDTAKLFNNSVLKTISAVKIITLVLLSKLVQMIMQILLQMTLTG